MKGTKIKEIKKTKKKIYDKKNNCFLSKIEKKNIVHIPTEINIQCLRKKK